MSGMQPAFITGATAKIRLNGKTLAFCQDFNCTVQISTKTPKVLGKFEGDSVEPLSYLVSGSFTVVRYAKGIRQSLGAGVPRSLAENDAGNGVGNWGTAWGGTAGDFFARNGIGNDGRAHEALDPSKFANGTTFDIQIYQKVSAPGRQADVITSVISDVGSVLRGGVVPSPGDSGGLNFLGILNVRNARITQMDFGLTKRGAAMERFSFVALYVDGDSYVANGSAI